MLESLKLSKGKLADCVGCLDILQPKKAWREVTGESLWGLAGNMI